MTAYGRLTAHSARTHEEAGGGWRVSCAQCGYWSKRTYATEERGLRAAQRHDSDATAQDLRVHALLYGPRPRS